MNTIDTRPMHERAGLKSEDDLQRYLSWLEAGKGRKFGGRLAQTLVYWLYWNPRNTVYLPDIYDPEVMEAHEQELHAVFEGRTSSLLFTAKLGGGTLYGGVLARWVPSEEEWKISTHT